MRFKVIVLLACILGLDAADKATIGATAVKLEQAFHIGDVEVGLLVAVTAAVGALTTLPLGILVDRVRRVRLLVAAIAVWSLAIALSGFSTSWLMLLFTRFALGAVVAIAAPAVASLTGDFFHAIERGRVYGFILTGELVGAAFGFLISGSLADIFTWRVPFWVLAAIGLALAAALHWLLPEPARGGRDQLNLPSEDSAGEGEDDEDPVEEEIEQAGVRPDRSHLPTKAPAEMSWFKAIRYILSIRTYVLIAIASAMSYFYLTGLKTFGVVYMHAHFGLSETAASATLVAAGIGGIVGVLLIGRLSDRLIEHGMYRARLWVAALAFLGTVLFLVPGFLSPSLYATGNLFFIGAIGLGGVNPPMNAARLDVMHSRLWGRAESVRSTMRYTFVAIAPIVFGYVSSLLGGAGHTFKASGFHPNGNGFGLALTLAIMLVSLIGAGVAMFFAMKSYPRDVATAHEFEAHTRQQD